MEKPSARQSTSKRRDHDKPTIDHLVDELYEQKPEDGHVQSPTTDSGLPVAVDEDGEIQLRGPNLMRGICGRPRSTVFTIDGWYPTGDLGRLDAGLRQEDVQKRLAGLIVLGMNCDQAIVKRESLEMARLLRARIADGVGKLPQALPVTAFDQRQAQRLKVVEAAFLGDQPAIEVDGLAHAF